MNNEKSELMQKEGKSNGEKTPAWYEILISDYFIDYVKSDPNYDKDFENENSVIRQLWGVLDGFTIGNIIVISQPTKAKSECFIRDHNDWYNDWVMKGCWSFVNDEKNERDIATIAKSIREINENMTFYEHDPNSLSEVQLAFLILYSTWDRPFNPYKYTFHEFTLNGYLKEYLLPLKKRHEATTQNETQGEGYER